MVSTLLFLNNYLAVQLSNKNESSNEIELEGTCTCAILWTYIVLTKGHMDVHSMRKKANSFLSDCKSGGISLINQIILYQI